MSYDNGKLDDVSVESSCGTEFETFIEMLRVIKFKLSKGVLTHVGYDELNPKGSGETQLSMKAEYKCCSVFCERFSRQISEGKWIFGSVQMAIEEESNVGISFNGVQVCHSSYLEGIFGNVVTFSPFVLEGESPECIQKKNNRHYKQFVGVGRVVRITAESSGSTMTVKFSFTVSRWSKDFMLTFMKENEHGTLGSVNAEVIIREEKYNFSEIPGYGIYFMVPAGFCYGVVLVAIIMLMCTRTNRGFLKQTWATYDEYQKLKLAQHSGLDNIALEEIS